MKYQELVDVYSALEATTKRLEKTEIISNYLKTLDSDTIEKVGLLILGTVFPAWSSEEIGIGGKLVIIDALMAGAMIGEGTSYEDLVTGESLTSEQYGVGFRKNSDVTAELNSFLKECDGNGKLSELAATYKVDKALIKQ